MDNHDLIWSSSPLCLGKYSDPLRADIVLWYILFRFFIGFRRRARARKFPENEVFHQLIANGIGPETNSRVRSIASVENVIFQRSAQGDARRPSMHPLPAGDHRGPATKPDRYGVSGSSANVSAILLSQLRKNEL